MKPLDAHACYRAIRAKDARFDGRFFTGVRTTGIYCRPVCPAKTPLIANCSYFRCAAEAEEAGFRPCLRCHPESAPGTPAWSGTSATVARAFRLIHEGALAVGDVDELADRVGVGSRQLRRLFREHLGATPRAVERSRRLHLAKVLLDQTTLPIEQIARSSGYGSGRRLRAAFSAAFGRQPSEVRRRGSVPGRSGDDHRMSLRLHYRPPLAWSALRNFLGMRALPTVERWQDDTYRRNVRLDGVVGWIEVRHRPESKSVLVEIPASLAPHVATVAVRVRALFDLDADPSAIHEQLETDERLRSALRRHPGLRVPGCWDRFELAVRAILGQQVTVKGACTLADRLVTQFGDEVAVDRPTHLFPTPDRLADADMESVGLIRSRAGAIRNLANAIVTGKLVLGSDKGLEESVREIVEIPGIGEWTAQYIAMRALREPDAFPASDLVILRRLGSDSNSESPIGKSPIGNSSKPNREPRESSVGTMKPANAKRVAEAWRPWRAYATMAIWTDEPANPASDPDPRKRTTSSTRRKSSTRTNSSTRTGSPKRTSSPKRTQSPARTSSSKRADPPKRVDKSAHPTKSARRTIPTIRSK